MKVCAVLIYEVNQNHVMSWWTNTGKMELSGYVDFSPKWTEKQQKWKVSKPLVWEKRKQNPQAIQLQSLSESGDFFFEDTNCIISILYEK